MADDSVTVSECDDLSCSVKRQLGVFNGIILLPGNKARKLGVDSSSDIIDATNLVKNSPDLIKQDVEYTSSTGIIEVVFQAGQLITAYSAGFEASWESGVFQCHRCEAGKYKANDGMNLAYDNSRRCSAAGHALVAPVLAGLQA